MRVAFVSHNACPGDALGNQLAEKVRFFLDRAADVRVFLELHDRLHPQLAALTGKMEDPVAWEFLAECDLIFVE